MNRRPLSVTRVTPYAHLTDEEVLLRYLIVGTMKQGVPGYTKPTGPDGKQQPVTVADLFLNIMEKTTGKSKMLDNFMSTMFKRTAMRVFFGGETLEETLKRCDQLLARGTGVIVDYAAPENASANDHAAVVENYCRTIDGCATLHEEYPDRNVAVAIKVSTLADYGELKDLSHEMQHPEERRPDYEGRYKDLQERFESILKHADKLHVRSYVDAELTEVNPLIRKLCYDAAEHDIPLVMTVQAYLKEADDVVNEILALKKKPGVKLVRGAYMGEKFAAERPHIWDTKKETDTHYNHNMEEKLNGHVPVLTIASHNKESLRRAGRLQGGKVDTATLLGMGDGLEINEDLDQSKYVPFPGEGSILGALAYFGRRGTEFSKTTDDSGKTRGQQEFDWIREEMKERSLTKASFKLISNVLLKGDMLPASRWGSP